MNSITMQNRYAIITGAERERLVTDSKRVVDTPGIDPMYSGYEEHTEYSVKKERYLYRQGWIGLLHGQIVDWYMNFGENARMRNGRHYLPKIFDVAGFRETVFRPTLSSDILTTVESNDIKINKIESYLNNNSLVPILLHNSKHTYGTKDGYFIALLKKGEFIRLHGQDLKQKIKSAAKKHNISIQENIEDIIRSLESFDKYGPKVYDIPLEEAPFKISNEDVGHERLSVGLNNQPGPRCGGMPDFNPEDVLAGSAN